MARRFRERLFNTLGNIWVYPKVGPIFPDWHPRRTLQVTGTAEIDSDPGRAASVPGAERVVRLAVENVVDLQGQLSFVLELRDRSAHNPE